MGRRDEEGLVTILRDRELDETVRLGAVEGLTRIGSTSVDAIFIEVATDDNESDDLKKSLWRALRRVRRRRAKLLALGAEA